MFENECSFVILLKFRFRNMCYVYEREKEWWLYYVIADHKIENFKSILDILH